MDINAIGAKAAQLIKKYRYPLLVLLVGLVLITLPGKKDSTDPQATQALQPVQKPDTAQELSQILSQIQGVGKVKVMLTIAAGENTIYQTDEDVTTSEGGSTIRKETVIVTDSDRNSYALITQVIPPEFLGAVIVCQGADRAEVRLAIVEAVSKATGLGADCISVLKMK